MTLKDVVAILEAEVFSGEDQMDREVHSGYASDLLSEVMANAKESQLWFTIQTHPNIAAVALLVNVGAIVITGGHKPDQATITKSKDEGLVLIATKSQTFDAIYSLCKAGL